MIDPEDYNEAETWFAAADASQRRTLAFRSMLRELPRAFHSFDYDYHGIDLNRVLLLMFRAGLSTGVTVLFAGDQILNQVRDSLRETAADTANEIETKPGFPKILTSLFVTEAMLGDEMDFDAEGSFSMRSDLHELANNLLITHALLNSAVWSGRIPKELENDIDLLTLKDSETWSFWRSWYQSFLDGKPVDWELQRRVALIREAIWDEGPERVAREIQTIECRYAVETTNSALTEHIHERPRELFGIGHNNPPEGINDFPVISYELGQIETATFVILSEVADSNPDTSKLTGALDTLGTVLSAVAVWFARKLDISVDEFLKTLAKSGGVAISGVAGTWLLGLHSKLHSLIEALVKYLGSLS